MREILFRGKTTPKEKGEFNNIWVFGDLIYCKNKYYIHPQSNVVSTNGEIGQRIVMHEVIPETVSQWTGLVDKNGVKIFEGDIIKCSIIYTIGCYPHSRPEVREVIYREGCFNPLYDCERNTYEVIGNKYDNPELLKQL